MIPVPRGCRDQLSTADFSFIAETLAPDGSARRSLRALMTDRPSLNRVLDDPALLDAVLNRPDTLHVSLELYFLLLVRHALRDAGIDDFDLVDYIASTLAQFVRRHPSSHDGDESPPAEIAYHTDLLQALDAAAPHERFFLHVQSGNQFLVLTGIFPRFLARRSERRGAPGVDYYEAVAQTSFRSAGRHPLADEFALRRVYATLAEAIHPARLALNRLADEYLVLSS